MTSPSGKASGFPAVTGKAANDGTHLYASRHALKPCVCEGDLGAAAFTSERLHRLTLTIRRYAECNSALSDGSAQRESTTVIVGLLVAWRAERRNSPKARWAREKYGK